MSDMLTISSVTAASGIEAKKGGHNEDFSIALPLHGVDDDGPAKTLVHIRPDDLKELQAKMNGHSELYVYDDSGKKVGTLNSDEVRKMLAAQGQR